MRSKFWKGVAAIVAIVAAPGAAGAADLAVKAPVYKAPPPVILSDWAGFYVGGHGGYGWGSMSFDDSAVVGPDAKPKGGVFGAQAGYNWQYGSVVAGVEVDFSGADISESGIVIPGRQVVVMAGGPPPPPLPITTRDVKFDALASTRARLGYAVLPNLLAYGTAGPGLGHSTVTEVASPGGTTDASAVNFGWVAGGGLEYKLWDHVMVRAEYLHYDFLKATYSSVGASATSTVDVVRGGLSYKF